MNARQALDHALVAMAADGERPRCCWPGVADWFTSDDREDRARAARRCSGCPALELCAATAEEEQPTAGVWGGNDWTRHPSKTNRDTKHSTNTKEN